MHRQLLSIIVFCILLFQSAFINSLIAQDENVGSTGQITIVKAIYGDGKKAIDCTSQVRDIVKQKQNIQVTLSGLKIKNIKGQSRKGLQVQYRVGDVKSEVSFKHRQRVNLYAMITEHAGEVKVKSNTTSVQLPGKITQLRTGGGGQFLICKVAEKSKLFVVDVYKKAIVKQIPVSEGVVFAAGQKKLLIALPLLNQLQKWDLATLKREAAVPLGRETNPQLVVMGCSSQGPLGIFSQGKLTLWDIDKMSPQPVQGDLTIGSKRFETGLTVSADGKTFCGWALDAGKIYKVIRVAGDSASATEVNGTSRNNRWAMPNPDGSLLLSLGAKAHSYDFKPLPLASYKDQTIVPCEDPRFVLAMKQTKHNDPKHSLKILNSTDFGSICDVGAFDVFVNTPYTDPARTMIEPMVRFLHDQKLIVSIPGNQSSINIYNFDLQATLAKQNQPYLFTISRPPSVAHVGQTYQYQVQSLTHSDQVSYTLDMGPKGMQLSSQGKVTWPIKQVPADGITNVVITAEGGGETVAQGFEIHVVPPTTRRVVDNDKEPNRLPGKITGESHEITSLQLPGKITEIRTGGGGKFLVCEIEGQSSLFVIDVVKQKVVKKIPFFEKAIFAAGREHLMIAQPRLKQLQKWSFTTLEREAAVPLPAENFPTMAVLGSNSDGPLGLLRRREGTLRMHRDGELELWDIQTMTPKKIKDKIHFQVNQEGQSLTVSADGQTFTGKSDEITQHFFKTLQLDGDLGIIRKTKVVLRREPFALPNSDGSLIVRHSEGVYTYNLKPLELERFKNQVLLPTPDPRYLLALKKIKSKKRGESPKSSVTICDSTLFAPICDAGIFEVIAGNYAVPHGKLSNEPAIRFLPDLNLFVSIPESRDSIDFRKFDLQSILDARQVPYLNAISRPPAVANVGEQIEYQIQTLTNAKNVHYKLDTGPEGMTVTPTGKVIWTVKETPDDGVATAIVQIEADNGMTALHQFETFVRKELVTQLVKAEDSASRIYVTTPKLDGTQKALLFDEQFTDVRYGGAGRFGIFHFADSDKIRIVDMFTGQETGSFSVSDNILFAANRNDLIVVHPAERTFDRWSLSTGTKINTATFVSDVDPSIAVMGASGEGPLAIWASGNVQLFDSTSLEQIDVKGPMLGPKISKLDAIRLARGSSRQQRTYDMSVSADGKTFCGWKLLGHRQTFQAMRYHNSRTTLIKSAETYGDRKWMVPSTDGSRFFVSDGSIHKQNLQEITNRQLPKSVICPTTDPRFVISPRIQDWKHSQLKLFTAGGVELVTANDFLRDREDHYGTLNRHRGSFRYNYLPETNVLAYLPFSNDRIILRSIDIEKSLAKHSPGQLVVTSTPPAKAFVGDTFSYQPKFFGDPEGVKYSLDTPHSGMTIDQTGRITWPIKSRPLGGVANVKINIKNRRGESFWQTFELAIERKIDPDVSPGDHVGDYATIGFVPIDDTRLELPAPATSTTLGRDGRQLVLCENKLAILGDDGWSPQEIAVLEKSYLKIFEREDYYVAIANQPHTVDLIDKQSLEVTKSISLPGSEVLDIAIHPELLISYITIRSVVGSSKSRLLVFDETTGEIKKKSKWIGSSVVVDSVGKNLYTAFHDTYRRGSELVVNPNHWHIVPRYGSIDWLVHYQLDSKGKPELSAIKDNVGTNGQGISLSANGRRITFLSFTGFPKYSKNVAAWDTHDLTDSPIRYPTKDVASCKKFVFHNSLPLGLSPGENSIAVYDQETGQLKKDGIKAVPDQFKINETSLLYFSPAGKHVIAQGEINGVHYLQKLELQLSEQELIDAGKPVVPDVATPKKITPFAIPLKELEMLAGGAHEQLTPAGVAKKHKRSVVVVRSGASSGTGFVVGKSGYIMTCAHCVPEIDDVSVSVLKENGKWKKMEGKLLLKDDAKDIALLKINSPNALIPVQLGLGHPLEMGMPVSVIGNPGVGDRVLDHTMTEGIVSSTDRNIENLHYIQISAAVNPGNSGGPMFDRAGNVIGMVVLKARIEGAGFAIPAKALAEFLIQHRSKSKPDNQLKRSWRLNDDSEPIVGTLQAHSADKIRIKRSSDDKELELEIKQLSKPDQAFLEILSSR